MKHRILWWGVVPAAAGLLALVVTSVILLRPAHVKSVAEDGLSKHLNLTASIDDISVSFWPRWRVSGRGLSLRIPNRPDLPAFIRIDEFTMNVGLLSILRKHVETVHADGLHIAVPPKEAFDGMAGTDKSRKPEIIVDHFVTHDAELMFVPRKPDATPLLFLIHALTVDEVGFGREMPFEAALTNPVPRGQVRARGRLGPWQSDSGAQTQLSGEFTFSDADLSTINGIGGVLQSTGKFSGDLTTIAVSGEATVPDFSLDLGGKPVPFACTYQTTVDGTDGSTVLERVEATLLHTQLTVQGAIRNLAGPGRHEVALTVHVPDGNIEDLLALALDTHTPVMTGDITLDTTLSLPPGPTRVRDRLKLAGTFGLTKTRFTDADVQSKLTELSRRSQGKGQKEPLSRVLTNLRGRFHLASGVMRLGGLTFQVPGANVALDGSYSLLTQVIDLRGTLRMQATVSKAVGGFKSIFIKPFDPLFKKNGAGAVLPIKITGPREAPKFGLEAGRLFKG